MCVASSKHLTNVSELTTTHLQSGDPAASTIDLNLLSGCALAIADVDDINKVTMDNLAIFSVNHQCAEQACRAFDLRITLILSVPGCATGVKQKMTTFQIPAKMPPCTGSKCICGWFWLANNVRSGALLARYLTDTMRAGHGQLLHDRLRLQGDEFAC